MSPCKRFAEEGILRLERGLPLDEHFVTCNDCVAARRAFDHLRQAIRESGAQHRPPSQWQAKVWARIEQRRSARRRPWIKTWRLLPLAAAAAIVVWVSFNLPLRDRADLRLEVLVEPVGQTARGLEARPGDRLLVSAKTGGKLYAELRIYRAETELVLHCSDAPPCLRRGNELEAVFVLPHRGIYQTLLLASDDLLPVGSTGFDGDAGAALRAGARVEAGAEIDVR